MIADGSGTERTTAGMIYVAGIRSSFDIDVQIYMQQLITTSNLFWIADTSTDFNELRADNALYAYIFSYTFFWLAPSPWSKRNTFK